MNAVIFTHPPDYALAALSARSLGKLGVKTYLAIDRKDPVPEIEGAEIIRTSWPRRGNLNGTECLNGILRTLHEHADGADYVLKVDSDTIVRGLKWLEGHEEPAVGLRHVELRCLYGACYALRVARLPEYRRIAARMRYSKTCSEDVEIGTMLPPFTYENRSPGCPFSAYSTKSERTLEEWKRFEVLVFQPQYIGSGTRREIRQAMEVFA